MPPAPFPVCPLHATPIVTHFPDACPFRTFQFFDAIAAIRTAGYRDLEPGQSQDQIELGLIRLHVAEVCTTCVGIIAAHPCVRRLRGEIK